MEGSEQSSEVVEVRVKGARKSAVLEHMDIICSKFGYTLLEVSADYSKLSSKDKCIFKFEKKDDTSFDKQDIQSYVDGLCTAAAAEKKAVEGKGENENDDEDDEDGNEQTDERNDSSYDSDYEGGDEARLTLTSSSSPPPHEDVSRTVSDTLQAEFEEYVNTNDTAYISRVEFGLKLGYSEKLVQAALQKLGPNPEQNELLEELIKLGAQGNNRSSSSGINGSEEPEPLSPLLSSDSTNLGLQSGETRLRPIVVDGSNVAMSHGNNEVFSCRGIKICVDWFRARGHQDIIVFVPKWRKESPRTDNLIKDQDVLLELERERALVFTPSRLVGGKRMICYDDRYILRLAADMDGIVVSNDNYRDLAQENPEFRKVVNERILMYSFVNDRFMPPDDPLGRSGPSLDNFLSGGKTKLNGVSVPCPYGKKCTYGNKCKFEHPERGLFPQKSVSERLLENAQRQLQTRFSENSYGKQLTGKSISLPLSSSSSVCYGSDNKPIQKTRLSRTKSITPICLDSNLTDQTKVNSMVGTSSWPLSMSVQAGATPSRPVNWPASNSVTNVQYEHKHQQEHAPINLHAKLQRQLSLNPTYDPRLNHLQNFVVSEHERVARAASCDIYTPPPEIHQTVTRIASAPLSQHTCMLKSPSNMTMPPSIWSVPPSFSVPTEDRNRLRYHLSSIFPVEQVETVMQMYPSENNPQKLCAIILSMFPIGS